MLQPNGTETDVVITTPFLFAPPPPTVVVTVPVADDKAVDALSCILRLQGYDQIVVENVTRITATRPPADTK